jgi:GH35 family endo-1,4-beta-xylanase
MRLVFYAFFCLFIFEFNVVLNAQSVKVTPIADLFDDERLFTIKANVKNKGELKIQKNNSGYEIDVITKEYVNEIYDLAVKLPLKKAKLKKQQKILLSFEAMSIQSSFETGESKSLWQLKINDQYVDHIQKSINIGQEWKQYFVAFEIQKPVQQNLFSLILQFGYPPQHFKLRNIIVQLYDANTPYASLPKTINTYSGIDADAQWRKDAFQRIEKYRKGDIQINITEKNKPIKNALVKIEMTKHEFKWGVAARVEKLLDNKQELELLAQTFNLVVLENDLKMKFWNNKPPKKDVLKCIDQLREKQLFVKGHTLIWPGFRHLPDFYKSNKDDKDFIYKKTFQHINDILKCTANNIYRWDVVNEAYSNQDLQNIMGSEQILYDAFLYLKKNYPHIKRNVNEFGILSSGGLNKKKQDWYFDFIKRIDQFLPGAVNGIGMQSHIGADLTPPERVLAILDRFSSLNKKICISEFTLDIEDPLLRKIYTEDFLIAAFSHPSVEEFLFWGYKGNSDSKVDIFDAKNNLGTMGQAYFGLVHGLWMTDSERYSDSKGQINERGFFGEYSYTVSYNGKIIKGIFNHDSTKSTQVTIAL